MTDLDWAVPLLQCPVCRAGFTLRREADDPAQGSLSHESARECRETYPVIDGIPRVLVGSARAALVRDRPHWFGASRARRALAAEWAGATRDDRVVRGFDAEWSRFSRVGSSELRTISDLYFDLVPARAFSPTHTVLDAGCGAGRWAIEVASRGPRVLAVDLGLSIEVARRNAAGVDRIACVQGDLRALPVATASVDWAYSLGVLHHLDAPVPALRHIGRAVRPSGLVLLYLYYALDGRGPAYRAILAFVTLVRGMTSHAPRPALNAFASLVALAVYWPLARASAILSRWGLRSLADAVPLSFYRDRSLEIMRNDSLDRFGTSIEHRYTRADMEELMRSCGLASIRFSENPPYWHAVGGRSE